MFLIKCGGISPPTTFYPFIGGFMARGVMCDCGCRSIVTDINPKTNRLYSKCEKAREIQTKIQTKRRNQARKKDMSYARNSGGSLIYDTRAWRRLSDKKRTVDPFCEQCLLDGIYNIANIVDHIVEVKDNPKLAYDWNNLRSLCHTHHNAKTQDEKGKRNGKNIFEYV